MKLKLKSGLLFITFGLTTMFVIILSYYSFNKKVILKNVIDQRLDLTEEVASHMESHILEKILITTTISSAPVIEDALNISNKNFSLIKNDLRSDKIDKLNSKWINDNNLDSTFIKSYLNNKVSNYLKRQQILIPGEFGEIFITNRYGVLVASTGKLTTLSHAHKYWWKSSYSEGDGKIFIDDRGFDNSVNDVVLGIVIPIKEKNKIIGIIKSNYIITGSLTNLINDFNINQPGSIKLARTNGKIILESKASPLSTKLDRFIQNKIKSRKSGHFSDYKSSKKYITTYAPINITLGSKDIVFGGSSSSQDHINGNTGEAWHIILTLDKNNALTDQKDIITTILRISLIFILLMFILASILVKMVTKPLDKIIAATYEIGNGNLDAKVEIKNSDELGVLAKSINIMTKRLKNTLKLKNDLSTLNNKLIKVDKSLKKANSQLKDQALHDGLTELNNRRFFDQQIKLEWKRMCRNKESISLIIFDVDYFKLFNDTYGHQAGDRCLKSISEAAIKSLKRPSDFIARYGGEEFVIILPNTPANGAKHIAEKVAQSINKLNIEHKNSPVCKNVTISSGLATMIPKSNMHSNMHSNILLEKADKALYKAKERGRNNFVTLD